MIIISGHDGSNFIDSVYQLNLTNKLFSEWPSLLQPRSEHSSVILGRILYVFCGYNSGYLDSIERLNVDTRDEWTMFTIPGLSARTNPLVAPLNDTEVLVAGGHLTDVFIVNPEERTQRAI